MNTPMYVGFYICLVLTLAFIGWAIAIRFGGPLLVGLAPLILGVMFFIDSYGSEPVARDLRRQGFEVLKASRIDTDATVIVDNVEFYCEDLERVQGIWKIVGDCDSQGRREVKSIEDFKEKK